MSSRRKLAFEDEAPEESDPEVEEEEEFEEEEEEDEEEEENEMDFELEAMDETLAAYLTTEDGDNVATALMSISDNIETLTKTLETQNKILVKLVSHFVNPK